MHHSSLARKLVKPAKRAWKSFTNNLQSKLQSFKVPKTLKTLTHGFINFCSLHLFIPFKKRFITKSPHHRRGRRLFNHRNNHHYYSLNQRNFATINIDNLYSNPHQTSRTTGASYTTPPPFKLYSEPYNSAAQTETASSSSGEEAAANEKGLLLRKGNNKQSVLYSVEDAWNAVVASSPQLRCVDERAEEFIYKFREDMKIQRERSLLEYQEMLARSA